MQTLYYRGVKMKKHFITNFRARELLVPIFKGGELVYKEPTLPEIQDYCRREVATLCISGSC